MDQGPLVTEQIDAGAAFLDRIDGSIPVAAAFWLKSSEGGRWYLYVASEKINDRTIRAAYGEVFRVAKDMGDPNLDPFQVKLIGIDDPLARAALDIHTRFPARIPTRFNGSRFGDVIVEGVYVYPPPPYGTDAARWRGIAIRVWPEADGADAYRVEFWPKELMAERNWGGQPRRVPRPAAVRVVGGKVAEYRAPEKPLRDLTQADYEEKALEAVKDLAANPA
jgi:hypothetical protein